MTRGFTLGGIALASLASLGVSIGGRSVDDILRDNGGPPPPRAKRRLRCATVFDPQINRWTGEPHQHRRERARRNTLPGTEARRMAMAAAKEG